MSVSAPLTPFHPRSAYPPRTAGNPSRPAPRNGVRFSGVGDAVSSFIGLIDRNRAAELVSSDGLGMLLPRTVVAAKYRGVDDARETLIREGAGLVCVALLSGFGNQAMIHLLGNGVNAFNPHGTPAKAWINAKNLRVFSQVYDHALEGADSLPGARQAFIRHVLHGLESGDRALSVEGRIATLKTLAAHSPDVAEKTLTRMLQELYGDTVNPAIQKKFQTLLKSGNTAELRQQLLDAGWGTLSKPGRHELAQWFAQKAPGDTGVRGTMPFDQLAVDRLQDVAHNLPAKERDLAFRKTRLSMSLAHLQDLDPEFARHVDEAALKRGLTSVVHLKDPSTGKVLLSGQSRQTLLKELKYFLEHYVDRAGFDAASAAKRQGQSALRWTEQQQLVRQKLFASSANGLRALLPHAEDGLVTAMLKAKRGYTWAPILIAITANGISTFLNNYLTRKKYGGRVFFPGEEAFSATKGAIKPAPGRFT